jgi:DNA helicase II / ATP-dependent DNA helicase PcrA
MNRADRNLNLKGFIANIQIMEENNIRLEESSYGVSRNAVTLTTGHKSKGLEWEHVYIYSSVDKTWGNNSRKDKITLPEGVLKNVKLSDKEKNEDERRLFYVAVTRAKSNLTITRADSYNNYGTSKQAVPSMFLSELGNEHVKQLDTQWVEEEAHKHIESLLLTQPRGDSSDAETAFLKDLADNFKLAATSLNSYLLCAYKFKLDKLLKVPHAKKAHLSFGTAVHKALENFYTKLKTDKEVPSKEYLIKQFEIAMNESIITKQDLKIYTEKGQEMLSSYYDQNVTDFHEPLATEQSLSVKLGDIELTGKIDRLEWADKAAKLVRVIDYKTGTPKTMGQIEGTTKDSDGELRRQLEFYKVLVDNDKTLNYQFGEGMLDFIEEPQSKGKDGKRRLMVKDEDAEALKQKIKEVMKSIRALEFPRTTNYQTCEKCYFKDHCWPNGIPTSSK